MFVVTENGLAKRTPVGEYRLQGRGGLGIKVAKISERGGDLVGALIVDEDDEVLVVMERGKIVRSRVDEVTAPAATPGRQFAKPDKGDAIIAVARNAEKVGEAEVEELVAGDAETAKVTGRLRCAGRCRGRRGRRRAGRHGGHRRRRRPR